MKMVVFGCGQFYRRHREDIKGFADIIAFIDNNPELWGTQIDGKFVYPPDKLSELQYDTVALLSRNAVDMKKQLLQIGIDEKKILFPQQISARAHKGERRYYCNQNEQESKENAIAILVPYMYYVGGALASLYAAKALQRKGYVVDIIMPDIADKRLIEEMQEEGYNFIIYDNLLYADAEELAWLQEYKYIIGSGLTMIHCMVNVSQQRRVFWWIHETESMYENALILYQHYDSEDLKNIDVYAVGKLGCRAFNKFYPQKEIRVLEFGMPDSYQCDIRVKNDKFIFAIIGTVCERKAQKLFIEAAQALNISEKEQVEFWIIGELKPDDYCMEVQAMANNNKTIVIQGQKTREEMQELLAQIDVVVCMSKSETGPIVVVEGMMYNKLCITTDTTELARFIENGVNGFVCESQNVGQLTEKMRWTIHNKDKLSAMGREARKVYDDVFSIDKLGDRLIEAIQQLVHVCASKDY